MQGFETAPINFKEVKTPRSGKNLLLPVHSPAESSKSLRRKRSVFDQKGGGCLFVSFWIMILSLFLSPLVIFSAKIIRMEVAAREKFRGEKESCYLFSTSFPKHVCIFILVLMIIIFGTL